MIQKQMNLNLSKTRLTSFHKFYYNDADDTSRASLDAIDFTRVENGSVKVVVVNKSDFASV